MSVTLERRPASAGPVTPVAPRQSKVGCAGGAIAPGVAVSVQERTTT